MFVVLYSILNRIVEMKNYCSQWDSNPLSLAHPFGHLFISHMGLAFVLKLTPLTPELVMSKNRLIFRTSLVTSILLSLQTGSNQLRYGTTLVVNIYR